MTHFQQAHGDNGDITMRIKSCMEDDAVKLENSTDFIIPMPSFIGEQGQAVELSASPKI